MRLMPAFLLAAPLAACAATAPGPVGPGEPLATCSTATLPQYIGQPATQELGARMLATSGARVLRWVAVGQMVTMDFRGDRLTVRLTAANRVESASCG